MSIKEGILKLKEAVLVADANMWQARSNLDAAESSINNHVYESLEAAQDFLSETFREQAHEDCEGAGNCGCDAYTQDFIVDGKEYTATGSFEYNRHDKTYYIEESSYRCEEKK